MFTYLPSLHPLTYTYARFRIVHSYAVASCSGRIAFRSCVGLAAWREDKLQQSDATRYYGTLLKAEVEVQGAPTEYGLQHGLQGRRRRRERPGQPAALQGAPGIKPALHLPQRARPRSRRGRAGGRGWRALRGDAFPPLSAPGGGEGAGRRRVGPGAA